MDSDSRSSSSPSSSSSSSPLPCLLDKFGRPVERPDFCSIGESSVLSRVKSFLPLLRSAELRTIEPNIKPQRSEPSGSEIKLPRMRMGSFSSVSSESSCSSYGVEVNVGIGVFEVNGNIDNFSGGASGIPIIESLSAPTDASPSETTEFKHGGLVRIIEKDLPEEYEP